MPALTPVTVPEATVANAGVPLDHVPPVLVSPSRVVAPTQTVAIPVIGAGKGLMVTVRVPEQPEPVVIEIIEVPAVTPVTMPVEPTVEFELLELQVPELPSDNVVVEPTHSEAVPVMTDIAGFTVTTVLVRQPVAVIVYLMVAVTGEIPVTTPVNDPTVACAGFRLVQVPPVLSSVRFVVAPAQTLSVPSMADGNGLIVSTLVLMHPLEPV